MKALSWIWNKCGFIVLLFFIIVGFFNKSIVIYAIICMLGPIVFALLGFGRLWCKKVCPRGNLYDNVICKLSEKKSSPRIFKSVFFRVVIVIFVFIMFGFGLSKFGGEIDGIGMILHRMIIITTVVGIFLALLYRPRSWCCICPMGSIACFISKCKKK